MALSVIADCVYISEISPRVNCVEHLSQIMLQSSFSIAVSRKKQSLLNVSFVSFCRNHGVSWYPSMKLESSLDFFLHISSTLLALKLAMDGKC